MSRPAPRAGALITALVLLLTCSAPASARDYADQALNIVPSGQYGGLPVPAGADEQARMYDALTPLGDQVSPADLQRTFKSAKLGDAPGPTRTERVPRKGVRIVRDRFNVPHIRGNSRDDVVWAMGWVLQQDRGLLLAQGRNPGRIAALDVPGVSAFGLVQNLVPFKASRQADRIIVRQQERNLRAAGRDGRAIIRETQVFVDGINARLRAERSDQPPFTRADVYGFVALIVKMDDVGLHLSQRLSRGTQRIGLGLVRAMPLLLRFLSVVGIAAMLWVGGHILLVGLDDLGWHPPYELVHHAEEAVHEATGALGGLLGWSVNTLASAVVGLLVGAVVVAVMHVLPLRRGEQKAH